MDLVTTTESRREHVRTYLRLTQLLDAIERDHPEVSAPMRLTLLRARNDGQIGLLDESRFRDIAVALRQGQHAIA